MTAAKMAFLCHFTVVSMTFGSDDSFNKKSP